MASDSIVTSIINSEDAENRWVETVGKILTKEQANDIHKPISIIQVPKSLTAAIPEAYIPQEIALGPYHHFRPNLYHMEKCKLDVAQHVQKQFNLPEFPQLFDDLKKRATDIRSCYHDAINLHDDTLSCIMVIDSLFLINLIHSCFERSSIGQENNLSFKDSSGREPSLDSILRDSVMLENQIPVFVVKENLIRTTDDRNLYLLNSAYVHFCTGLSPVELDENFFPVDSNSHLLDLLYQMVWHGKEKGIVFGLASDIQIPDSKKVLTTLDNLLSKVNVGYVQAPLQIVHLILNALDFLGISIPLEAEQKPLIPSASKLFQVGLKFSPTHNGIEKIKFEKESNTLHLPVLNNLNPNSDAVIRNLLAYEALTKPRTPNFARYIEMMAAVLSTVDDVQLLREEKIIVTDEKITANAKVVELFHGTSNSVIGSKGETRIDDIIKGVNEFYYGNGKIKLKEWMKRYMFCSWKIFIVIATIAVLVLMALQTFCSIYGCSRIFNTPKVSILAASS